MPVSTTTEAGRVVASAALARQRAARADTTTPIKPAFEMENLPDDLPTFSRGAARRPQPQIQDPLLQWATGLQTTDRRLYAGWFVETNKQLELDQAMRAAGFQQITIKHGSGKQVTHWALPEPSLFVVCDGVQTISEMRDATERYGVAFGWRTTDDGRKQSVLRCRVFVQELLTAGYTQPLLLSLKSTLTGDFLECLIRHYEVLDTINPIRAASGKPPIAVPFYAVALALGPGAEVQRGSGGQSKAIAPMCEVGARDKAYILAHWCKREWVQAIEALADETLAWSIRESERIAAGEEREEWEG